MGPPALILLLTVDSEVGIDASDEDDINCLSFGNVMLVFSLRLAPTPPPPPPAPTDAGAASVSSADVNVDEVGVVNVLFSLLAIMSFALELRGSDLPTLQSSWFTLLVCCGAWVV
jgi:hypothetical protein